MHRGGLGELLHQLVEIRLRPGVVAAQHQGTGAQHPRGRIGRRLADRVFRGEHGALGVALLHLQLRDLEPGADDARVEPQRLVIGAQRVVRIDFGGVGVAEDVLGPGRLGIGRHRRLRAGQRFIMLALAEQHLGL